MTTTEHSTPSFEVPASKELPRLDYNSFKDRLLGLHNQLLPNTSLHDFDADKNEMGVGVGGVIEGAAIRYPRHSDKIELLRYALGKAQACEDPRDGALLLAASVTATHLFLDGNGRVARALYSDLMGVKNLTERDHTTTLTFDADNRRKIDLGSAFTQDSSLSFFANQHPYQVKGIRDNRIRIAVYNFDLNGTELEQLTLSPELLAGLSDEEQVDLVDAVGADEYGNNYRTDVDSLTFAANQLISEQEELSELITRKSPDDWGVINLHKLLAEVSPEQRKKFVAGLWEYRKLYAQAAIDFLSDEIGIKEVQHRAGGRIALRDLVIERTNNLHASRWPRADQN